MDPNLSDQNFPPKPTSSVGNVVPGINSQDPVPPPQDLPQSPNPPQAPPLTPIVSVSEPLDGGKNRSSNDSEEFYPKGPRINSKVVVGLFILIMVITIPATVFVARQPQAIQSTAAADLTPDTVIAIINGKNVLEKDLEEVASEQYEPEAIDREALKDALDTVIERKILDAEKQRQDIQVLDSEIATKEEEGFGKTAAFYEVLKDKVTKSQTKNWEVYTIGFWLPMTGERDNLTAQEKKDVQEQHDDGLKAISQAQNQMQTDKSILDIARELSNKYSSLKDILGVNGYLLRDLNEGANLSDVENPRNYTFEASNKGQAFFDTLYSLETPGQVEKYTSDKNSGAGAIKLVSAKPNAAFDNYEAFLKSKKTSSLVTVVFSL